MTTILATAAALILAALYVWQVRKRRAAETRATDANIERDEARCELAAAKIQLAVARKQHRRDGEMALQHAVACERAERERDALTAAYLRLDAEFEQPANVVALPAKRRPAKKAGAK